MLVRNTIQANQYIDKFYDAMGGISMIRPTRKIDYQQVMRQVNRIRQLSTDLTRQKSSLNNVLNDIVYIWKGEAATDFNRQGESLETDMQRTADRIDRLASRIVSEADRLERQYQREMDDYEDWVREQEERRAERARARARASRTSNSRTTSGSNKSTKSSSSRSRYSSYYVR